MRLPFWSASVGIHGEMLSGFAWKKIERNEFFEVLFSCCRRKEGDGRFVGLFLFLFFNCFYN